MPSRSESSPAGSSSHAGSSPRASSSTGLGGGSGEATPTTSARSTAARPTGPVREIDSSCPYIGNQQVADIEGNRVGRSTVLTSTPRGCRFYFAYADGHMTAQITVRMFATPTDAFNAMTRTGAPRAIGDPHIADGAVLYQTRFYPPDGDKDWACTFAAGRHVVTVNTDQTSPSTNARNLARAIAGRF